VSSGVLDVRGSCSPRRLSAILLLVLACFGALGARLIVLQIFEGASYDRLASDQRERAVPFPARRGAIFDRSGNPLAISVDLQTIYADPALVEDAAAEGQDLAKVLGRSPLKLETLLRGDPSWSRFEYIARRVSPRLSRAVEALDLPGVYMKPEPKRFYPNGALGAQVLGFVGSEGSGLEGIEAQYEDLLRGRAGRMTLEQDPSGRPLPQADLAWRRPDPGRSLYLTIDKDIQFQTELFLKAACRRYHSDSGNAVVMDPHSGEVLAMASWPSFDPNHFDRASEARYRNRATTDVFEPGSSYKIVTASAALEEGVVTPWTRFTVPDEFAYEDRVFHDSHYHATERMSVSEIIEQSSNVGTIKIGLELGSRRLDRYVRKFGFGSPSGLGFPGESNGLVLDLDEWSGTTGATVPIGQGVAVTTVQMAAAYSALANDGVWVEPRLVSGAAGPDGSVEPAPEGSRRRIVSAKTARQMTRMLTRVVKAGTGLEAQVPGYTVAGKTGTAQKALPQGGYGNSYVASFAGYAPVEDPAVAVVVMLDDPRPIWGGATAAPTFSNIADFTLRKLGIPPSTNARRAAAQREAAAIGLVDPHD
jgi:cell division protein FtsI (penicillin-binding protein 3)